MSGNAFDQKEWADLEDALRQRGGPEPGAEMTDRILGDVRRVLGEPARLPMPRWDGAAAWAAVAAVLIVGLALSQMAASVTPFFQRPGRAAPAASVHDVANLMRQVSPGLTADEADRLALASASGSQLVAVPIASADATLRRRGGGLNLHGDFR